MTAFKFHPTEVPAGEAFWYRMALMDMQSLLTVTPVGMDRATVDALYDAVTARYDEMWAQHMAAKATA